MATVVELKARLDHLLATAQKETADVDLYAPITERKECPICMIPIPLDDKQISFMKCCGKYVCSGCVYKSIKREIDNGLPQHKIGKCAFCRQHEPKNEIKALKILMKRDNSQAFMQMAFRYRHGDRVFQSDTKALEMNIRAAELGDVEAFGKLGSYYERGIAVEQDTSKAIEFYEVSAKKGSVHAHEVLAEIHGKNGNTIGIEHLKVAASAGEEKSKDLLMEFYKVKLLSKEDLAKTLRAHQTSLTEMKSKERDDARAFRSLGESMNMIG